MKGILKAIIQFFQVKDCKFCECRAVVKWKTYDNRTVFMCSDCLRAIRFIETDFYKSIENYNEK